MGTMMKMTIWVIYPVRITSHLVLSHTTQSSPSTLLLSLSRFKRIHVLTLQTLHRPTHPIRAQPHLPALTPRPTSEPELPPLHPPTFLSPSPIKQNESSASPLGLSHTHEQPSITLVSKCDVPTKINPLFKLTLRPYRWGLRRGREEAV